MGTAGEITHVGLAGGYLSALTNPNGEKWSMTYDAGGLMTSFTKPGGQKSLFAYDGEGLLRSDTHSGGASISLAGNALNVRTTSAMGRSLDYSITELPYSAPSAPHDRLPVQGYYSRVKTYADCDTDKFELSKSAYSDGTDRRLITTRVEAIATNRVGTTRCRGRAVGNDGAVHSAVSGQRLDR